MKKLISLLGFLIIAFLTYGQNSNVANFSSYHVGQAEAEKIAMVFAGSGMLPGESKAVSDNIEILNTIVRLHDDDTVLFVVNYSGKAGANPGFVIVPATKACLPVLAYSDKKTFKVSETAPALESLLRWYEAQLAWLLIHPEAAGKSYDVLWNDPEAAFHELFSSKAVSPLLTTEWNQGCYYNDMCPADASGPCQHVWAGCVATATAQIMKYHNYPPTGTGSHSYTSNYGTLSANFGSTSYNWSAMPSSLSGSSSTNAKTAVQTLLYHVGISVDMDYGWDGSSASIYDAGESLKNYFGYDDGIESVDRSYYTDAQWATLLKSNLDASLPVLLRGDDNSGNGGHAFVVDGYSGTGTYTSYFHLNWGWGGSNDGNFYLSDLTPGSSNYTYNQWAVVNIMPGVSSSSLPIYKDFEDADMLSGGWQIISKLTSGYFNFPWHLDEYNGEYYAKVSGYSSGVYYPSECWFISPRFGNAQGSPLYMHFTNAFKWPGPDLQVLISTNWDGNESSLFTSNWYSLSPALSQGNWQWVSSGHIDLSAYYGANMHVAFRYVSTETSGSTWEIDNIWIGATPFASIGKTVFTEDKNLQIFPNPCNEILGLSGIRDFAGSVLTITNMTGSIAMRVNLTENSAAAVDVSSLSPGLYQLMVSGEGMPVMRGRFIKE